MGNPNIQIRQSYACVICIMAIPMLAKILKHSPVKLLLVQCHSCFFHFEHPLHYPQQHPTNHPSQHSLHHTPQHPPYHTTSAIMLSTSKGTLILDCSQTYLVFIQLYDAPQRMGVLVFVAPISIHKAANIQQCCSLKNTTFMSHCADSVLRLVYHEIGGIKILLLLSRYRETH